MVKDPRVKTGCPKHPKGKIPTEQQKRPDIKNNLMGGKTLLKDKYLKGQTQ